MTPKENTHGEGTTKDEDTKPNLQTRICGLVLSSQVYDRDNRWEDLSRVLNELSGLYRQVGDSEKIYEVSTKQMDVCRNLPGKTGLKVKARYFHNTCGLKFGYFCIF